MSAVIQIEGLNKTYRMGEVEVQALRNVSLSVERGEFLAIMGASGSGKSTLMNIIGCLDRPTGGRYLLEGIHVASLKEEQLAAIRSSRIGFVFQTFNLLARTTAIENVELPLFYSERNLHGEQRAGELLEMLGLKGRENNNPNQLSGGQQQRVAIARSLINRPAILLADEPTGNLDSKNSAEIMEIISRLNREQGITVLVVTHDADVAAYTDRVVTFRDGAILSDVRTRAPAKAETLAAMSGSLEQAANGNGLNRTRKFGTMALSAAARALRRNKTRAALTMLGIFIGVAAVIAMVAVGNGARYSVQQQIQSLGTNLLVVLPGATTANGVRAGAGSISTLTVADGEAIQKEVLGAAAVSYADHQVAQVVYAHQNWSTSIAGTTPIYLTIRDWPVVDGRNFTDEEERSAAPVCLLGRTVVNNLYGPGEDPVGTVVRVKNFPLRVVGVLGVKGQSSFGTDQDDVVLLPFNTAERKVLGTSQVTESVPPSSTGSSNPVLNPYIGVPSTTATNPIYAASITMISPFSGSSKISGVVNLIFITARSAQEVDSVQTQVQQLLHRRHRIGPREDDDFTVRSLSEIAQASESASAVMTLLLAAVASISLLVGGIGIMNIMLVSVTERTREIGIRMAVGARRVQILFQFLVESALLSIVGGLAGVALGIVASKILSALASWPTLISPVAVFGGFAFAAAVGLFFGWYPARKASRLDPIEALRYE
ncbi:ABC transporter permease [Candidatus Binatus sp.]|uniref:ABC transporter permease n=1 Tax=Candidatus Binatus sp. TaxID=2811406 RepID=UPI003C57DE9E